jgi:hypothetical protein
MKFNAKVLLFSLSISFILILALGFTGLIQKPMAICRATIHVMLNYWNQGLWYHDAELVTAMSSYKVTFIREDGSTEYISVSPYEFPIHIMFDSQNPGG